MLDMTYKKAIELKDNLLAIGEDTIWLRGGMKSGRDELPWSLVTRVESGSTWRLDMPASVSFIAEQDGLTFRWSMDLEERDANGRGVSMFDRENIRFAMMVLNPEARVHFTAWFQHVVLPGLMKRTAAIRASLSAQLDSEDCVRGLIAFASEVAKEAVPGDMPPAA